MKQQIKEIFKIAKRNWLTILILAIVLFITIPNFIRCLIFGFNYDSMHEKYLNNELWQYYVTNYAFMMTLDITWTICIMKWATNKIVKKEIAMKKKEEQNLWAPF